MAAQKCPNCGNPYQLGDLICSSCGFVFPFSTNILPSGTSLHGRYEIQELIHSGGMGYIYLAQDKNLFDRLCVIKQVRERLQSKEHQEKVEEEALRMARLSHPNVAMILDHFVEAGHYFLVVEYIRGKTLSEVFEERNGILPETEVLQWARAICDVLVYLHSEGIIHRDISPDNIMLTSDGSIKFIDFGTLRELRKVTDGGTAGMGKFGYTPPEQWQGKPEPRSDIFALGATLYFLLTGFLPLSREYQTGQGSQRVDFYPDFPPVRKKNPDVSPQLEGVLQKALPLDINKRYASALDMQRDINSLVTVKIKRKSGSKNIKKRSFILRALTIAFSGILILGCLGAGIYYLVSHKTDLLQSDTPTSVPSLSIPTGVPGTLCAWGKNNYGQLGDSSTIDRITPVRVSGLFDVIAVDGGGATHCLALKSDGTVWEFGMDSITQDQNTTPLQVKNLSNVIKIAADTQYSLALKSDGSVWAWGENWLGMLGNGTYERSSVPVQVSGLTDIVDIDAGICFSLALKSDGSVWAWGENNRGQIGIEMLPKSNVPVQVTGLNDIIAIDAGGYHSLALKSDGTVWAWGWNRYGQLGCVTSDDYSPRAVQASGIADVITVSAGNYNSLVLKSDGTVWSLGSTKTQVSGIDMVVAIESGENHNLALKSDGSVWAWGDNSNGQLGIGSLNNSGNPVMISGLARVNYISVGYRSSYAIMVPEDITPAPVKEVSSTEKPPVIVFPVDENRIAYIYLTDLSRRDEFESFLESRGYTVDTIAVPDIPQMNLTPYGLIIVGEDTGSGYTWGNEESAAVIKNSNRPVLGMRFGGLALLNKLGSSIDNNCWTASGLGLYIEDPDHIIFNEPNKITVPEDRILDVGYLGDFLAGYAPALPESVKLLVRQANSTQHYIIMQEGKYFLWGFDLDPSWARETALNLFINIVHYLITSGTD